MPEANTTLPTELSSFVGRRAELARLQASSGTRLTTITGPGGVGKTRLAIHFAHRARRSFPGGVHFVDLAGVATGADIMPAVAAALHLRQADLQAAIHRLSGTQALLVIDNAEHVVESVGAFVPALVRSCPRLRVIVTSQRALETSGEHVLLLDTLPTRASGGVTPSPASQLFIERAAQRLGAYAPDRDELTDVEDLCRRLDGLPYAIELAAARADLLTPADMLSQLESSLALLGTRDRSARHESMSVSLAWSYGLCSPIEQAVWRAAAVFADGFELDALTHVAARLGVPEQDVLNAAHQLIVRSVFTRRRTAYASRVELLDVVRQFGREQLAAEKKSDAAAQAHVDWYVALFAKASRDWLSPAQRDWIRRFPYEFANADAALRYAWSTGAVTDMLSLTVPVWREFWGAIDRIDELDNWLSRICELQGVSPDLLIKIHMVRLYSAGFRYGWSRIEPDIERFRQDAERKDDGQGLAYAAGIAGLIRPISEESLAQLEFAVDYIERSPAEAPVRGVEERYALMLDRLRPGSDGRARAEAQVRKLAESGDVFERARILLGLGANAALRGEVEQARRYTQEGLELRTGLPPGFYTAASLESLALLAQLESHPSEGARLLGLADRVWVEYCGNHPDRPQVSVDRDQVQEHIASALGEDAYRAAHADGYRLDIERGIAWALHGEDPHAQRGDEHSDPLSSLTPREREVVDLVSDGHSNRMISDFLYISVRTVEGHVQHVLNKFGLTSRGQLTAFINDLRALSN